MSDDKIKKAQALAASAMLHTHAIHTMLDGLELMTDARLIAAAYIARAGNIMATLRVRGITERDEIEAVAEHFVLTAMNDKNAGIIHDETGKHETLPPGTKTH